MSIRAFCLTFALAAACSSGAKATAPAAPAPESKTAAAPAAASDLDPKAPVARIGGQVITAAELDEQVKGELRRNENDFRERQYQIRSQGLEQMINKRLLETKMKGKKQSPEEFLKKELASELTEPSRDEIQQVYDRAKASGQQLPPMDQVKDQIVSYLKEQKSRTATAKYYAKLKEDTKVETLLPPYTPPRVEVEALGPSKGPEKAPVTIIEFSDFQCPFCGRAESTVSQVMESYKDKVRLVFRDFPLPGHAMAQKASEAALCANDQGKYWEMHDKLFANQQKLEVVALKGYAKDLGLNASKFEKCLDSGEKAKLIEASKKAGAEAGVSGTPAFFINGKLLSGALPFENFKAVIDAELAQK